MSSRSKAFTLLEIMLAVAVLALVTITIHRFVASTLIGIKLTSETQTTAAEDEAFIRFFKEQLAHLPLRQAALTGEAHVYSRTAMDEIRWVALPGFGALTQHARGEQTIILTVQETKTNGPLEIGLRRQDIEAREEVRWYPLLTGVKALEIRYLDPTSREWMDKWTDQINRPSLVRLRYWRGASEEPFEVVASVPYVSEQALIPQFMQPSGGNNRRRGERNRPPGEPGDPNAERPRRRQPANPSDPFSTNTPSRPSQPRSSGQPFQR